jgi:chromosome segregation ATPase
MANEYGELEQLVNDVTSLDTARMTLRWALERLQNIEKEKADLKKNLTLAEETAKRLQLKESSLRDSYESRNKTIEEKEDFYTKLEATMALLGEGKLDVQQLLKKEAKLDSLRRSLETEYQEKFEELDRSQRAIMERWNARLLDVESQYAGRLSEAQKKYDSLRAELDAEHQGRLTALQASFKAKEKEFNERLALLEGNVRSSEERVETRRRELEAEYLSKKRETEENYRKLRSMLENGLEEKIRAADSDHAAQVSSLEASWQAERSRLLEEQRVREEQFLAAQDRIKEIENNLAAQQEKHHSELLKIISEKEGAFRAQLAELEKEKAAKENSVRELSAALEKRAAGWEAEKAALRADFDARAAAMEAAFREREAGFERDYAARKEAIASAMSAERGGLEKDLENRMAGERAGMAAERARLAETKARLEAALAAASDKIKELENNISSLKEDHRGEIMARVSAAEASFREKLAAFETERRAYNDSIKKMEEELRARDAAGAADRQRLDAEAAARASVYEGELTAMAARLEAAAREAAAEREKHGVELSRVSAEAAAKFEVRSAELKTGYEAMAARIKADAEASIEAFKASFTSAAEADGKNRGAERARLEATLEQLSGQFRDAQVEIVELNTRLRKAAEDAGAREAALTGEVIAAKASFDRELSSRVKEAVLAQTAALVEAMEALKAEKAGLADSLQAKHEELLRLKEDSQRSRSDQEARILADFTRAEEDRRTELEGAYAARQAALEDDFRARRSALEAEIGLQRDRLTEENAALKSALEKISAAAASANARSAELAEKLLAAEKNYHAEKLGMQTEHVREAEASISEAVAAAVEVTEQRLRHAQDELAKARKEALEEAGSLEAEFAAEKDRLLEEMDRRDRYIESAEAKMQELEREMLRYRQDSSSELMRNISEQDKRFRDAAAEEKARTEARLKQLEELLEAKEKLLADSARFCRQKQLELDKTHAELNQRLSKFNEELYAQKQELSEKEQSLSDYRLKLEKEYSIKAGELEQMKAELTRAIMDYKGRK